MIRKIVKTAIILFVSLIVLALIIPFVIPSDFVKPRLIAEINAITGKQLTISGPLRFSFFPSFGLHAGDLAISNPPGTGDASPLAAIKSMDVRIDTSAFILHGNLVVQSFQLIEPKINIHIDKTGVSNWQQSEQTPAPVIPKTPTSARKLPHTLNLSDVDIHDGALGYADDRDGTRWDAQKLNVGMDLKGLDSPMVAKGSLKLNQEDFDFDATVMTLQTLMDDKHARLEANIKSGLFTTQLKGAVLGEAFVGEIDLKSASIKKLMAWAKPAGKPLGGATPLALDVTGHLEVSPAFCNLTKAKLALDTLKADGSVLVNFEQASVPQVNLDLTTNVLDLNPFLAATAPGNASIPFISDAAAAEKSGWSQEPIDLSPLMLVDSSANLRVEGAKFQNITIGKGLIQGKLQHGHLGVDIVEVAMYDGKGSILATVDAPTSAITSRIIFKNIQVEKLMKDVNGSDRLSGTGSTDMTLAMRGKNTREMISSLSGNGALHIANGAYKGFNIADIIHNIKSITTPQKSETQKTDFSELGGTFTIAQGIVSNNDLSMKSPLLRVKGNGTVNLPNNTINYRLTPELVDTAKGQGGADKAGLGVPVIVQGSLDAPTFTPDLKSVITDALKDPKAFQQKLKSPQIKDTVKSLKSLFKTQ